MYSKILLILASLMWANAFSIKDDHIVEIEIQALDTVEGNLFTAPDEIAVTPKLVWPVNFFTVISNQQLIGQVVNHTLPIGTDRVRLTFNSGFPGPGRITNIVAYVYLPLTSIIPTGLAYTVQYQTSFHGDVVLNYNLPQLGYISIYIFAIV